MAKITYYSGNIQLKNIQSIENAKFLQIGGIKSPHNRFDSFQRLAGHPVSGPDAILPVTRRIEYKSNPSKHKCGPRCRSAKGHQCECECGGEFHGINS